MPAYMYVTSSILYIGVLQVPNFYIILGIDV